MAPEAVWPEQLLRAADWAVEPRDLQLDVGDRHRHCGLDGHESAVADAHGMYYWSAG